MGLLILPFLLAAFIITVVAIVLTIKLLIKKLIGIQEIFLGFIMTSGIFGLILLSYKIAGRAWALSTGFVIPIVMVFIPFAAYFIINRNKNIKLEYFSQVLLISVGISGILATFNYEVFFEFFDYIGVEKIY